MVRKRAGKLYGQPASRGEKAAAAHRIARKLKAGDAEIRTQGEYFEIRYMLEKVFLVPQCDFPEWGEYLPEGYPHPDGPEVEGEEPEE